jgi:hypothetical protein
LRGRRFRLYTNLITTTVGVAVTGIEIAIRLATSWGYIMADFTPSKPWDNPSAGKPLCINTKGGAGTATIFKA